MPNDFWKLFPDRYAKCDRCDGAGSTACSRCGGRGVVYGPHMVWDIFLHRTRIKYEYHPCDHERCVRGRVSCDRCNRTGSVHRRIVEAPKLPPPPPPPAKCQECKGSGRCPCEGSGWRPVPGIVAAERCTCAPRGTCTRCGGKGHL